MLNEKIRKPIPYFEMYVSFLSTMLAIILLKDATFLDGNRTVYTIMSGVATQAVWSIAFAVSALLSICGLVWRRKRLRKVGLVASIVLYATLGYCYYAAGSYVGASAFVLSALFSLISIFEVDRTELR
ncbi:hypothetical protein MKZ26_03120 [Sporosarcina sp. FSL K6-6792]|uniref:hypothetical protein n=1 Tax=Sporosarcina sp. FSL K6-6792 TaxID=2921559 RepID=UPI0030F5D086